MSVTPVIFGEHDERTLAQLRMCAEDAMSLVGRVADRIERDDPYGALREATDAPLPRPISSATRPYTPQPGVRLDLTGGYRLLATLCAG